MNFTFCEERNVVEGTELPNSGEWESRVEQQMRYEAFKRMKIIASHVAKQEGSQLWKELNRLQQPLRRNSVEVKRHASDYSCKQMEIELSDLFKQEIGEAFEKMKLQVNDIAKQEMDEKIDHFSNQVLGLLKQQTEKNCEFDLKIDQKFDHIFDFLKQQQTGYKKQAPEQKEGGNNQNAADGNGDRFARQGLKIKIPVFNGENPLGWLYKCSTYFDLFQVQEMQKVRIATYHLEGHALIWFLGWKRDREEEISWEEFAFAFFERFEERMIGIFKKFRELKQEEKESVKDYMVKFEWMKLFMGMEFVCSQPYYVGRFIHGLNEEIKHKVTMLDPKSLTEAYQIASLDEIAVDIELERCQTEPQVQ